jgi:hypothetical protein
LEDSHTELSVEQKLQKNKNLVACPGVKEVVETVEKFRRGVLSEVEEPKVAE